MYPIILCIHINKSKLKFIEMTLCWASNKYLAHHHSFFLFRSSISKVYYNLDTQFAGLIFLASFVWKMEVTQTFSFIKNLAPDIWSYVGYYLHIVIVCYSWLKDCPSTKAGQFEENVCIDSGKEMSFACCWYLKKQQYPLNSFCVFVNNS